MLIMAWLQAEAVPARSQLWASKKREGEGNNERVYFSSHAAITRAVSVAWLAGGNSHVLHRIKWDA